MEKRGWEKDMIVLFRAVNKLIVAKSQVTDIHLVSNNRLLKR